MREHIQNLAERSGAVRSRREPQQAPCAVEGDVSQKTILQRCRLHLRRTVLAIVPKDHGSQSPSRSAPSPDR